METTARANTWLNNTVLKGDWAFKGVLMSDWGAAHDTLGVANGGLDLEMPSGEFMNPSSLKPLLASNAVSQATIDDKVRRILRLEIANGFLDRAQETSTPKDDPRSAAVALKIAREAVVLLKNEHGALPLTGKKIKRIVVLGPNSSDFPAGGGSAHVEPFHYVSVVDGLGRAAPKAHIEVIPGPGPALLGRLLATAAYEGPSSSSSWLATGRRAASSLPSRRAGSTTTGPARAPAPGVDLATYWARWTGTIRAPAAGKYIFLVQNHGNVNVRVGEKEIIESWSNANDTLFAEVSLEAGKTYPVAVEVRYDNQGSPAVRFAWGAAPPLLTDDEAARVRAADAVVVCVGYNIMLEGEGADRAYDLPNDQPELIRRAVSLNPRTIVVVNSGGVVATADWIGQVPAVLQAWYPGQEGGRAVADIIMGAVESERPAAYHLRETPGGFPFVWQFSGIERHGELRRGHPGRLPLV